MLDKEQKLLKKISLQVQKLNIPFKEKSVLLRNIDDVFFTLLLKKYPKSV